MLSTKKATTDTFSTASSNKTDHEPYENAGTAAGKPVSTSVFLDFIRLPECISRVYLLAWMGLKKKNKGSDLGWIWSVIKPLMYIGMFYAAISMGFKSAKEIEGIVCPYSIWLATGIIAWQYLQELLLGGTTCFKKHKLLIQATDLPLTVYPVIPVLSGLYIHLIMVVILIFTAVVSGVTPSVYWLQLPLFIIIAVIFSYVWAFLTGLLNTISTDIINIIKSVKPAFFWLSGILFNSRARSSVIFTYNPITFIIEGYRSSICFRTWFWENESATRGFCLVMLFLIVLTLGLYIKLRNRISEML